MLSKVNNGVPMPEENNELETIQNSSAAPEVKAKHDTNKDFVNRQNLLGSTIKACKYITVLPGKRFRNSDRVTDILAAVSILLLLVVIIMPSGSFQLPLIILCDVLFLLTVIIFTLNRFGILTALSERQFILVWDIILGAFLLGILFSANYALILNYMRNLAKHF